MIEYEFALFLDGDWAAGGSSASLEEVIAEANHYKSSYEYDGEVELKFYKREELSL